MAVEGLHHIAVYTKDVDESIDFYSNLLGFKVDWRNIVDHPTGKIDAASDPRVIGEAIVIE